MKQHESIYFIDPEKRKKKYIHEAGEIWHKNRRKRKKRMAAGTLEVGSGLE